MRQEQKTRVVKGNKMLVTEFWEPWVVAFYVSKGKKSNIKCRARNLTE